MHGLLCGQVLHGSVSPLMGRRIRWLGAIMLVCLGLVIVQLVNIQVVKAPGLRTSGFNPRNAGKQYDNQRGDINASDGTLLAESVRSSASAYHFVREYPQGSLYAQIVGYSSAYYGTAGIENEYNDAAHHPHPPRSDAFADAGIHPAPHLEGQPDLDG